MDTMCMSSGRHQVTLYDRVSKLLESFEWSDVSFLVGNEIIRAHKLILAISSPVFKVMLYGPMAEATQIIISDIEPEVFQLLLDFIYKDKVTINSLENACGLLYAAKKYMLPYLPDICLKYIQNGTSIKNVMSIFNFADWVQEKALYDYCVTLICRHADIVLKESHEHMSGACLSKILEQNYINLSEKELISLAIEWAQSECQERGLSASMYNKRKLLLEANAMKNLRFLTLSADELVWLQNTEMLTLEEMEEVKFSDSECTSKTSLAKEASLSPKDSTLSEEPGKKVILHNVSSIPRRSLSLEWSFCHRPVIRTADPLLINSTSQSIKVRMKCQKTVFIQSLIVPSRQFPDCFNTGVRSYPEHIVLTIGSTTNCDDSISVTFIKEVEYNSNIQFELPKPFILNDEEWYTVCFTWPGKKYLTCSYPLCYRPTTTCNSAVIFTFDDNFANLAPCGSFVEGLKFCI